MWSSPAGVRFSGKGMVYSPGPLLRQDPDVTASAVTVELMVQATSESTQGIDHILSFYDNAGIIFFVGQWKSHLIIRSRINRRSDVKKSYKTIGGFREIGLHQVFPPGKLSIVTITSNQGGTTVYVDGAPAKHYEGFTLLHGTAKLGARLVLGSSPTGTHQWDGVISGLALYGSLLNAADVSQHSHSWLVRQPHREFHGITPLGLYLFNEGAGDVVHDYTGHGNDLIMPHEFILLEKTFLSLPKADYPISWSFMQDVSVNLAGFVPLGVFLSLLLSRTTRWSGRRTLIASVLSGLCISLCIELVQAFIPGRDSSLVDLLMNTVGAGAGVLVTRQR